MLRNLHPPVLHCHCLWEVRLLCWQSPGWYTKTKLPSQIKLYLGLLSGVRMETSHFFFKLYGSAEATSEASLPHHYPPSLSFYGCSGCLLILSGEWKEIHNSTFYYLVPPPILWACGWSPLGSPGSRSHDLWRIPTWIRSNHKSEWSGKKTGLTECGMWNLLCQFFKEFLTSS